MKYKIPFRERHPKLYILFCLLFFLLLLAIALVVLYYVIIGLKQGIKTAVDWLASLASRLDAVVVVALITGAVSIIGVIISSIVSKTIEYKKSRREYLSQKREGPYGDFVEMFYKITQNKDGSYTEQEMAEDLSKFSKQITLYGSPSVVKKWVKFRKSGTNPDAGIQNIFTLEKIMNAMRKDLGVKKVKEGNLLAFFIKDIDELMKQKNNTK